jgi:sporulation protein YlmC with PRC-barrel domain
MDLVRDVLDKQLIDREGGPMGRADGLVMHYGVKSQPRITHIEIGGTALSARLPPPLKQVWRRFAQIWGPRRVKPVRIPWSRVQTIGRDIKLDVAAAESNALAWEVWIARHVIEHIPGSGRHRTHHGD